MTKTRLGLAALVTALACRELASESVTLTTYYPAPSGVYTQMITTQNTYLIRDGGYLDIGTTASGAPAAGNYSVAIMASGAQSGRVGIGTTAPLSQLQVEGNAGTGTPVMGPGTLLLNDPTNAVGSGGALTFGEQAGHFFAGIKGYATNGGGNTTGDLAFYTRNATGDASLTERMRIQGGGNVGIGTNAPASMLNVNGQVVAGAVEAPPGSEPFSAAGAGSGISMDDRAGAGNPRWVMYPSGGGLYFWNATNGPGVKIGQPGYVYIDNAATACAAASKPMNDTPAWVAVCNGAQFATWTQGFYIEGTSYQNVGAPNLGPYGTGIAMGTAGFLCCAR